MNSIQRQPFGCLPENKIISSFKRFIDEKKKNSFTKSSLLQNGAQNGLGEEGSGTQDLGQDGGQQDGGPIVLRKRNKSKRSMSKVSISSNDPFQEPLIVNPEKYVSKSEEPNKSQTNMLSETYQAQVISCYYSLEQEQQDKFWMYLENNSSLKEELSNLNLENFYYRIIYEITEFFDIKRNSPTLNQFLLNNILYIYNNCGDRIYVDEILRFDEEQHVLVGNLTKDSPKMCKLACPVKGSDEDSDTTNSCDQWVVKWNVREDIGVEVIEGEIEKWKMIENTGASVPKVLDGFMLLDFPVVVMEKLEQLEPSDYNQKLVISIISFIEKIIPLGVNNNLKPSNILKRVNYSKRDKEIIYLVADVTGMTIEPKAYGFKRYTWSPLWTSQVVDSETITTIKNDLIEFGYVLNWLSRGEDILDEEKSLEIIENVRISDRPTEVLEWLGRTQLINEQDIKMNDLIDLKKIAYKFPPVTKNYDLCKK